MNKFKDTIKEAEDTIFKPASNKDIIDRKIKAGYRETDVELVKPFNISINFDLQGIAIKYKKDTSPVNNKNESFVELDYITDFEDLESDIRVQFKNQLKDLFSPNVISRISNGGKPIDLVINLRLKDPNE